MRARAQGAAATRERILVATRDLIFECSYDDITLAAVGARAGVTFQTVLRHFGTKEGLIAAVAERFSAEEFAERQVRPGDAAGAARVLCQRYELVGGANRTWEALEDHVEVIAAALRRAREGHRAWLEEVFASALAGCPAKDRDMVIAQLYAATDVNTWFLWRHRLNLGLPATRRTMERSIRAVIGSIHQPRRTNGRRAT